MAKNLRVDVEADGYEISLMLDAEQTYQLEAIIREARAGKAVTLYVNDGVMTEWKDKDNGTA
jgi:hypothetical protein